MSKKKVIIINCFVFICIILLFEIGSRIIFPEFKNHIHTPADIGPLKKHSGKTMNVNFYSGKFFHQINFFHLRKPGPDPYRAQNKPQVIVIGDSISKGYGTAYEDIWWQKLQRLLNLKGQNIEMSAYGFSGNSAVDALETLKKLYENRNLNIFRVLYQFNFNDITPYKKEDLKNINDGKFINKDWMKEINKWRYEYGNRSVFFRKLQHYAGRLRKKTSGTCETRGLHALGQYTWSFGSRVYKDEAELYWKRFEISLVQMQKIARSLDVEFEIVLSPILYDVDKTGVHPYYNYLNYDFSCATINPRNRLIAFGKKYGIKIYDPAHEVRRSFEARIKEGNFIPYFFTGDDNHFTPTAASYVAEDIARAWR